MNVIDQRILIPLPPQSVWQILQDMAQNPSWQANCKAVTFITPQRTGQGMRYRYAPRRGKEQIVEITAWYDGVGYAYHILEGAGMKQNKGTIRLQEIAEGTIVQWMFEYEPGGLLGGFRNAVTMRRSWENTIIESLENLWQVASQSRPTQQHVARSLMREAPDVEQRSHYTSRHGATASDQSTPTSTMHLHHRIQEPQISDEDTRPRPAVSTPASEPKSIEAAPIGSSSADWQVAEPDFLAKLPDAPEPATIHRRETPQLSQSSSETGHAADRPAPGYPPLPAAQSHAADNPQDVEAEHAASASIDKNAPSSPLDLPRLDEDSLSDTSKVSVFDVFGLPKPSETGSVPAVTLDETAYTTDQSTQMQPAADRSPGTAVSPPAIEFAPLQAVESSGETGMFSRSNLVLDESVEIEQTPRGRIGLRLILRRRHIVIRRPGRM